MNIDSLRYVGKLVRFAYSQNQKIPLGVLMSLCSVAIELFAMLTLYPLMKIVSSGKVEEQNIVVDLMRLLSLDVTAVTLLWTFMILILLRVLTQFLSQEFSFRLGRKVLAQLGSTAFGRIVTGLPLNEINAKSIGFYISLSGDEAHRASTLIVSLLQFVSAMFLAILYFVAIFHASTRMGFAVTFFLGLSIFGLFFILGGLLNLGARQTDQSRSVNSLFMDAMNNIKAVRSLAAEGYVSAAYRSALTEYTTTLYKIDMLALSAKLAPVVVLLIFFIGAISYFPGSIDAIGVALVVTIIIYLMRLLPILGEAAQLFFKILSDAKSGQDVTSMIRLPNIDSVGAQLVSSVAHIKVRHLNFSYDERVESEVLSNVNVEFLRGRSYAIVGKSGSGKSTLIDLMLKFYSPASGDIQVNNLSTRSIASIELRRKIVLVCQEPAIFSDTIAGNILMGASASLEEVVNACRVAEIHDFVISLPDGYQTKLEYQGSNLSGGQRQRIAIARALVRDPEVIVFDESTSALDKDTQKKVVSNILRVYRDRILIFISHAPELVALMDEVIELGHPLPKVATHGATSLGRSLSE